jgi:hypothetical protein
LGGVVDQRAEPAVGALIASETQAPSICRYFTWRGGQRGADRTADALVRTVVVREFSEVPGLAVLAESAGGCRRLVTSLLGAQDRRR